MSPASDPSTRYHYIQPMAVNLRSYYPPLLHVEPLIPLSGYFTSHHLPLLAIGDPGLLASPYSRSLDTFRHSFRLIEPYSLYCINQHDLPGGPIHRGLLHKLSSSSVLVRIGYSYVPTPWVWIWVLSVSMHDIFH